MKAPRAIFTSARTERIQGYHLVARSSGINSQTEQILTGWCPSEDGLADNDIHAFSLQCFPSGTQQVAIARTVFGLPEYSSRGSSTVFTQMILLNIEQLAGFQFNPLVALNAAFRRGYLQLETLYADPLSEADLPDRSLLPATATRLLQPHVRTLCDTACQLLADGKRVAVIDSDTPIDDLSLILNSVPTSLRPEISFSTGLKHSMNRPFQLQFLTGRTGLRHQLESNGIVCLTPGGVA